MKVEIIWPHVREATEEFQIQVGLVDQENFKSLWLKINISWAFWHQHSYVVLGLESKNLVSGNSDLSGSENKKEKCNLISIKR